MDRIGKAPRFLQARFRGFAPDQVGIGSIGKAARDGRIQSVADVVKTFVGAWFTGQKLLVSRVDIGGEQVRGVGVGARHHNRRHAHDVGR